MAMRAPKTGEAHVYPVYPSQDQFRRLQTHLMGFGVDDLRN
jgi:hypothetical protein